VNYKVKLEQIQIQGAALQQQLNPATEKLQYSKNKTVEGEQQKSSKQ